MMSSLDNSGSSQSWLSFERIRKLFNNSSFSYSKSKEPSSLLDAVENDPQRLKPITDVLVATHHRIIYLGKSVYERYSQLQGSFTDIFGVDTLLEKLKYANVSCVIETVSPYLLAGLTEYLIRAPQDAQEEMHTDMAKFTVSCIILGYAMKHRITEQVIQNHVVIKVMQQAASIWSLVTSHLLSYQAGYAWADSFLSPMHEDDLINADTKNCLNLLSGIVTTSVVFPKLQLLMASAINKHLMKKEHLEGRGTQSSHTAAITNGLTPQVNLALQIDDHFLKQLSDPSRLFQYFIVTLNVLKDTDIPDPSVQNPTKKQGWDLVMKKTRNVWLLAAESFIKAKGDIKNRLDDIARDTKINRQQYTVIRNGVILENVYRYELQVGDLVSLDAATNTVHDAETGATRTKAVLSGYLIQLGDEQTSKKVAINLAELNGETKPIILDPPRMAKTKSDCVPIDLHAVASTGAIFPGTEFLSFDNGNPNSTSQNLYIQIAEAQEYVQTSKAKIPFSAQQIADLKTQLIKGVFAVSGIAALVLMQKQANSSEMSKLLQFYMTEFIDKFAQVFVEAQTLIPLTADVVLELTNSELLRDLNAKLEDKITLNNALCMADLFEFLHKKNVRIYSDKTGTVTETFMHMRGVVCPDTRIAQEKVLMAFATTYSDQITEAEENEIRRYYELEKKIKISSNPALGGSANLEKTIEREDQAPVRFITKRVGLFTDLGGQFTMREQEGEFPVLVFCGAPKDEDNGERKFGDTELLRAHQEYEHQQLHSDQSLRQDSLTRDWSIAEMKLNPEMHQKLLEAMDIKDPEQSKKAIRAILQNLTEEFQYLGTFQIDNPIKQGAREAIEKWNDAGIGFMMITGDTKSAARLIAAKLYPNRREHIYDKDELEGVPNWKEQDLKHSTVILTDTTSPTMKLLDELEALGDKKPNIIFCQMKDVDKRNLVVHAKENGKFIIANGDGCNDLLMFKEAHIAIGDAARDGSFARDVQEASTFTDTQLRQLMKHSDQSLYQLLDIHKGKNSKFLKHFASLANTQPKVISSLLGKALKSVAVPRALGWHTKEIPGQFGVLLGYDTAFIAAIYQANIATANVPLVNKPINQSKLPYVTLLSAASLAAAQSFYSYAYSNQQVTTGSMLMWNLALSIGCLSVFLAPPGYAAKEIEQDVEL